MKRCLKLAVVCFLCAVGFAGSSNALVGHVPGVETKTDVAKCRRITKALLLGLPGTTADATPAGLRPLI